jgi:hypothetical protein
LFCVLLSGIGILRYTHGAWLTGFGLRIPSQKNLVVLPFTAIGGGSDEQVFCDGFTETVTAKLALDPSLQVTSALEIRAKNVTSIEKARTQFGANLVLVASWNAGREPWLARMLCRREPRREQMPACEASSFETLVKPPKFTLRTTTSRF